MTALVPLIEDVALRHADDVGVVAAGQAAIGGDDDHTGRLHLPALQQGVLQPTGRRRDVPDDIGHLGGVRLVGEHPGLGLGNPRSRDELHGARDLHRRLDALDPAPDLAELSGCHRYSPEPPREALKSLIAATTASSSIVPESTIPARRPL